MNNNEYSAARLYNTPLPSSIEAEQAVLGAILVDKDCLPRVMEQLRPECFSNEHHIEIFNAMRRLFAQNKPVDFVTVLDELVGTGVFAEEYGKKYLLSLAETVPSVRNVSSYCAIIREKYELRALILASEQIIADASDEANKANEVLDRAEQRIYEIAHERASNGLVPLRELIIQAYAKLSMMEGEGREQFIGTPTGISSLDAVTSGLNRSDLIIVAARPGMGKTSFSLNIASHVALKQKKKVAFFSLEMSREQLALRVLSTHSGVSGKRLREGNLSRDEWAAIASASGELREMEMYIDEASDISVVEMKAKLRRLGGVGLVVIDYLQLMSGRNSGSRVQDVSEITRQIKVMAKELDVPVMLLSQLNRKAEGRAGNKPVLSDLRDSGSIEQDADIVLLLYRPEYYALNDENASVDPQKVDEGKAFCIVAKNRHGETDEISLRWSGATTRFTAEDKRDAQ